MALGFRSTAVDLGENLDIKIYTDSVAALGIIGRGDWIPMAPGLGG